MSPSTVTTVAIPGSSVTWSNTGNASVSDDVYTGTGDITGGAGSYTDYLVATNFGFNIPGGAVVTGTEVTVERSDASGLTSDYRVRIVKGGVIGATEMSSGTAFLVPMVITFTAARLIHGAKPGPMRKSMQMISELP